MRKAGLLTIYAPLELKYTKPETVKNLLTSAVTLADQLTALLSAVFRAQKSHAILQSLKHTLANRLTM